MDSLECVYNVKGHFLSSLYHRIGYSLEGLKSLTLAWH